MAAPSPWVFASSTDSDKCLAKEGIPDVSCDGEVRIAVLGDSIVAGVGDEQYGDSGGGYVTRARMRLPSVTLAGVGKPGQTTEQLYRLVKTTLAGSSFPKLRATLSDADVIFLDIGRNDWWSVARRKEPPTSPTYGRIRRLQKYLRDRLAMLSGRTPIVVDLVSKRLYNADQLHPTALGYEAVTDVFVYYLTKVVPRMWADILDQRA
jgi:lysophospholipase L1-like esterase